LAYNLYTDLVERWARHYHVLREHPWMSTTTLGGGERP
jgi:hypothetical protein